MFAAKISEDGVLVLSGRFDAEQVEKARIAFNRIGRTTVVDCKDLDYISSAGLGVLLMTQKRLRDSGSELILANINKHIKNIFEYAGLDKIFEIR